MITIHSKFPHTTTSIFTEMSKLAIDNNAINLGQGFPDYPMDPLLIKAVTKAMENGYNQYAPSSGYEAFRNLLAAKAQAELGQSFDPVTEITITPGATNALFTVISTFVRQKDEVLYFDPAYDSYHPSILAVGGIPIAVPMQYPDFQLDIDLLKGYITKATRMIILNTPHNPTGATLKSAQLKALHELLKDTNIIVLCDEVYEHVIFDDQPHHSPLGFPFLRERSISVHSFGKMFNCTGWKTGYIMADAPLMAEIRKVHQNNAFSTFSPVQIALTEYMHDPDTYLRLAGSLQKKRDLLMNALKGSPLKPFPVEGSYFQLYSYEGFSEMKEKDFAVWLTKAAGITGIPLSSLCEKFGDHKLIRFCFAKKEATLQQAAEKLSQLGKTLTPPH
ncbi:methionine aminotransferase [Arachidicoccus terrestris]|uniref:methionine aminotransferase n=1 Tax=Arachidicoccus terrestris TaxID=2875539 RepID=UPI001CC822D8|nr:methionine aminotransferase [Arachidicoccus terrestris]UAY55790.1 aminotransferase class I/II-fold pyridoxal phosphate-dependent enzyme [Arachidicoccus terrestris]